MTDFPIHCSMSSLPCFESVLKLLKPAFRVGFYTLLGVFIEPCSQGIYSLLEPFEVKWIFFITVGMIYGKDFSFSLFNSRPEDFWKMYKIFNAMCKERRSFINQVVSFASCVSLTCMLLILIPLILWFSLIVFARVSTVMINRRADNGHPWHIPHFNLK